MTKSNKSNQSEKSEGAPETADSYEEDVAKALERETHDGKGDEDPGPSDFVSFATEGVEVEENAR